MSLKRLLFLGLVFTFNTYLANSQNKVMVTFKDKKGVSFNPYAYFDQKAIERRVLQGLPLDDFTDYPVNEAYINGVEKNAQVLTMISRWMNAVVCLATESQIEQIKLLPYVHSVELLDKPGKVISGNISGVSDLSEGDKQILLSQTARMGMETFTANNITGKGVRVAIFDIGFESYKTNPAFAHIRNANKIIKTWDFVKKRENVDGYNSHGTNVLSCIAGKVDDIPIGLATDAEFLLARTETWTEFYSEEEQWLAAAEWADKNGAQIINSSLGYTYHRYFPEDMNGKKSLVSRAATMAARKGILVVNSAGNEGDGSWKIIGTPADADSVLSIGGISPWTGYHTGFSSFGPTRDKRMKPNVTAYGHVIGAGPGGLSQTQGTSFSGPLVAGFAACAKQARPNLSNMALFEMIEKSADLYPYFDYAHGYGVPQASYFFKTPTISETPESKIEIIDANGNLTIKILDVIEISIPEGSFKDSMEDTDIIVPVEIKENNNVIDANDAEIADTMVVEEEFIAPVDENYAVTDTLIDWQDDYTYEDQLFVKWPDYVFFHIENAKGYLDKYWVVDPQPNYAYIFKDLGNTENTELADSDSPLVINKADFEKPFILRVYYKGEIKTYQVK